MTNDFTDRDAARILDEALEGHTPENVSLATLGHLRRALLVALAEVEAASRPKLLEHAKAGASLQRMAELAGVSIQTVRKVVVPGAAERNREWQSRTAKAGREVLGPKPARAGDLGPRLARTDRQGPSRVVAEA